MLGKWLKDILCKHDFKCKSALVDDYGKREFICCKHCGATRIREIRKEEKSD